MYKLNCNIQQSKGHPEEMPL